MILGGGPNRIGQGIEFDYCCVHAALALKKLGFETIIVNCNPETVSTDYDTSDKLYFEPLTLEDVLAIYEKEKPVGVIAQFGGQTPLNLAADLKKYGVNILGTSPETIDLAEDRDHFRSMMEKLGIPMPEAGMAVTVDEAKSIANRSAIRSWFVLPTYWAAAAWKSFMMTSMMRVYMAAAIGVTPDRPILIDRFLNHATECEADAISDGENCFVPAVMEHIELAGVHSGDSACILPSKPSDRGAGRDHQGVHQEDCCRDGRRRSDEYAVCHRRRYGLCAGGKSESIPYRSAGIQGLQHQYGADRYPDYDRCSDRQDLLPFRRSRTKDSLLRRQGSGIPVQYVPGGRPAARTGDAFHRRGARSLRDWGRAYYKAQEATQTELPLEGTVLISVSDRDKPELLRSQGALRRTDSRSWPPAAPTI